MLSIRTLVPLLLLLVPTSVLSQHEHHQQPFISSLPTTDESHLLSILSQHDDPVNAMISLDPASAPLLASSRLLEVMDGSGEKWLTEGDKLRLRRQGIDFIDLTGRYHLVEQSFKPETSQSGLIFLS
jgi:leucyl aminopeptidase